MTMKKQKSKVRHDYEYEEYEESQKKKHVVEQRRPIKNWKKAWIENSDDDLEDFYSK